MKDKPLRSIFISDVHLGYSYAQVEALHEFLKDKHPDFLYIIGDFIDGWKFQRKKWLWSDASTLLIRRILGFVRKGGKVYYAVGNHDEFFRNFLNDGRTLSFGHIYIANEFVHEAPDGKRLLIVHGDAFDNVIKYAKWMAWVGDIGYETLMHFNHWVNRVRCWLGWKPWSFSKFVKKKVKEANSHVGKFESYLVLHAQKMKCSGVICGHIHTPEAKQIEGLSYYNTGDWVESCSALVEYQDGEIELLTNLNQAKVHSNHRERSHEDLLPDSASACGVLVH